MIIANRKRSSTNAAAADFSLPHRSTSLMKPTTGKKSSITFINEEGEQGKEDLVYN